jgi:hypothetical protein
MIDSAGILILLKNKFLETIKVFKKRLPKPDFRPILFTLLGLISGFLSSSVDYDSYSFFEVMRISIDMTGIFSGIIYLSNYLFQRSIILSLEGIKVITMSQLIGYEVSKLLSYGLELKGVIVIALPVILTICFYRLLLAEKIIEE